MNSKNEISENNVTDTSSDELHEKLEEIVATVDTGARSLRSWAGWTLASVSLAWSLFSFGSPRLYRTCWRILFRF